MLPLFEYPDPRLPATQRVLRVFSGKAVSAIKIVLSASCNPYY